jgi:phenylalanine-4-hydroxylase
LNWVCYIETYHVSVSVTDTASKRITRRFWYTAESLSTVSVAVSVIAVTATVVSAITETNFAVIALYVTFQTGRHQCFEQYVCVYKTSATGLEAMVRYTVKKNTII